MPSTRQFVLDRSQHLMSCSGHSVELKEGMQLCFAKTDKSLRVIVMSYISGIVDLVLNMSRTSDANMAIPGFFA